MEEELQKTVPQDGNGKKKLTSIKLNFIYGLFNKVVAVLVPLLITPYLARILEPDGTGVISFVSSVSSYFILVANIGIETYGQRVIAIHRDDKTYLKKFFLEISVLRFILTAFCLVVYYICFVSNLNPTNNTLYLIFGLSVLAVVFDYSWFFQGVEDFKVLAAANVITRIIYIVLTFVLVKAKSDLNVAALLSVANTVLPFFLTLPFLAKYMSGKIEGKFNPFSHFKECMVYFIPTIAIQIYTVLDKTMIGLITGSDFENGYYEQAEKLVKLPLTITATLYTIMRSRISYYYSSDEYDKIQDLIDKSLNFSFALSLPMMFGIIAVTPTLVPVYLGDGYEKCVTLLYVMSPLIPIISLSGLLGADYYTPFNKQKTSNNFLIIGAVINVLLNSFMIYLWQSVGAAIASVCAEFVITLLFIVFARKFVNISKYFKIGYKYLIASVIMFVPVFIMQLYLPKTIWYLLLEIFTGITLYIISLLLLRVKFIYDYINIYGRAFLNKIRKK